MCRLYDRYKKKKLQALYNSALSVLTVGSQLVAIKESSCTATESIAKLCFGAA